MVPNSFCNTRIQFLFKFMHAQCKKKKQNTTAVTLVRVGKTFTAENPMPYFLHFSGDFDFGWFDWSK